MPKFHLPAPVNHVKDSSHTKDDGTGGIHLPSPYQRIAFDGAPYPPHVSDTAIRVIDAIQQNASARRDPRIPDVKHFSIGRLAFSVERSLPFLSAAWARSIIGATINPTKGILLCALGVRRDATQPITPEEDRLLGKLLHRPDILAHQFISHDGQAKRVRGGQAPTSDGSVLQWRHEPTNYVKSRIYWALRIYRDPFLWLAASQVDRALTNGRMQSNLPEVYGDDAVRNSCVTYRLAFMQHVDLHYGTRTERASYLDGRPLSIRLPRREEGGEALQARGWTEANLAQWGVPLTVPMTIAVPVPGFGPAVVDGSVISAEGWSPTSPSGSDTTASGPSRPRMPANGSSSIGFP